MPPHTQPVVQARKFNDFDAFTSSVPDWQLQFNQLDQGSFRGELEQCATTKIIIQRCQFNRRLEQQGTNPTGCRTFAIPNTGHTPYQWRRRQLTSSDLLSFAEDVELQSVSEPGFHLFAISINDNLLSDAAQRLGFESHLEILDKEHIVNSAESKLHHLRHYLNSKLVHFDNAGKGAHALIHEMETDLPLLILKQFISQEKRPPKPT